MRHRSSRRVVPWGLLREDPIQASLGKRPPASARMTFVRTCFRHGFRYRFSSLLEGFWLPTWAYVGSFLSQLSVSSWSLNLKSMLYWILSIFDHPDTSKIELPPARESNFQVFIVLILSSLSDSILAPKTSPKSSPRCSKIPSDMALKF